VNDQELGQHEEQVIGRALHALDDIELDVADDAAVVEYHHVLSYLPFDEMTPPPALEARVLDAARAARTPDVPSLAARHRKTRRLVAVGAAAAVAAAVTLALIVGGGTNTTQTQAALAAKANPNLVAQLQRAPVHHDFPLKRDDGTVLAHVIMSSHDGALYEVNDRVRSAGYEFAVTGADGERKNVDTVDAVVANGYTFSGPVTGAAIVDPKKGAVIASGMINGS
jgi:hypothetical protein